MTQSLRAISKEGVAELSKDGVEVSLKEYEAVVKNFFDKTIHYTDREEPVSVPGYVKFSVRRVAGGVMKEFRNPATGETFKKKTVAKVTPKATFFKGYKDRLSVKKPRK